MNVYEDLYENMKNRFTVINDNAEYTLGEIMLIKAGKKKEASNLPAVRTASSTEKAICAFVSYVNDKLTLKAPPVKDKTIRRFPFRTSAAAVLSAVIACTLVISYGSLTLRSANGRLPATAEYVENSETETVEEDINQN
ncbi:MAG: hypothetical protein E7612_01300 [Ruminococcaceae bacterium]|nr:hypothetical protein [Oscillospiraceae bacterium]